MASDRRQFLKLAAAAAGAAIAPNLSAQYTGFNIPRMRDIPVGLIVDNNICQFGADQGPCAAGPVPLGVMKDAGASVVHYGLYWHNVNPVPGTYDWDYPDFEIGAAVDVGLDVYLTMGGAPAWATGGKPTNQSFYCSVPYTNPDGSMSVRYKTEDPDCMDPSPLDIDGFRQMVREVVGRYRSPRYGGRVKWINFVNEPNYNFFWQWGTYNGDKTEFTPDFDKLREWVMRPGYETAKAVDPDILVVGPEMDDIGSLARFMRMEQEHGQMMDVVSFHGYDWGGGYPHAALDRTRQFRDIALNYGNGRPVWVTETGEKSNPRLPGSMRDQAERMIGYLRGVEEMGGIDHVQFYRLRGSERTDYAWTFKDNPSAENQGKERPLLVKPVMHAMREYLTGQPFPSAYPPYNGPITRRRAVSRGPPVDVMDTLYDPVRKAYVTFDAGKHEYVPVGG